MDASDDGTLRQVCLAEADAIIESGYSKPICTITLAEKEELVRVVKLHYTLLRNKAETDQLKRGLSILGLGEALETHTNLLQPMFLAEKSTPLTAGLYDLCNTLCILVAWFHYYCTMFLVRCHNRAVQEILLLPYWKHRV